MKIAHVVTTLDIGGAELALVRMLGAFSPGAEHLVIALRGGPLADRLRALNVPFHVARVHRWHQAGAGTRRMAAALSQFGPDIVHGWLCHANAFGHAAVVANRRRIPVIWSMRHSLHDLSTESRSTALLIRAMAVVSSSAAAIVYNSHRSAAQHRALGYDRRRTVVIPNGIDVDTFRPLPDARRSVRRELGLREDAPLIGLIARFHRVKDHRTFLRAAAALASRAPDVHFLLAGRDTDATLPLVWIRELGLGDRVHALGERIDIDRLTAALDVATCCSVAESLPNALGEAMACGVPCVTTDVGDVAELVGETGRVVPVRDAMAVAASWEAILALDSRRRVALGEAARARIVERYGLRQVAGRLEQLYADVASRPR